MKNVFFTSALFLVFSATSLATLHASNESPDAQNAALMNLAVRLAAEHHLTTDIRNPAFKSLTEYHIKDKIQGMSEVQANEFVKEIAGYLPNYHMTEKSKAAAINKLLTLPDAAARKAWADEQWGEQAD